MRAVSRRTDFRGPVAIVVILVALCTRLLWGLRQHVDIVGGDDAMYLNLSRNLPGKLMPDFAPIYVVWLKVLTLLSGDPITAYYFNMGCMALFPALALALFLKRAGMAWWGTALFSGLFLCSHVVVHLSWNTHVGHLAAGMLFLWLAWVVREKDPAVIIMSGALAALVISYVRPEFFLAFPALTVLWILLLVWRKWKKKLVWGKKYNRLVFVYATVSIITIAGIGIPLGQDAWRSWVAIFQHIIYNYALRHNLPYPFMESFNMTEYWKMFAGNSTDLKEIINRNMPEIKAHLAFNFAEYWRVLTRNLAEILLPARVFFNIPLWAQWMGIIALLLFSNIALKRPGQGGGGIFSRAKEHRWILFTLLVICAPGILFSFLIFPREHYLMAQTPFYLAIVFLILTPLNRLPLLSNKLALPVVGSIILLLAPGIRQQQYEKIWGPYKKITLVHDIKAIRQLPVFDHKVRLMERETNMAAFLAGNCPVWFPYKETSFDRFIDSNKVDVILVSEAMRIDRLYKNDSTYRAFTSGAYSRGWKKITVVASGDDIYVRKSLLGE